MSRSRGLLLAVESSCDETAVAVVERGRRIVADVVASQVALHSATGGIVPEVAARAHLRWMIPVLEEARQRAGLADWSEVDAVAVTEGPGLAGSLLVGITMAKTLAWSQGLPLVPVNHLEGHIYAAWLLDPARRSDPSLASRWSRSSSAAATPSWSRWPTTCATGCWGRPWTTLPARPSTRSAGCSACPTRAVRPSWPPPLRPRPQDRRFPRAWLGDSYDFSFSGLKTAARRAVGEALGRSPEDRDLDGSLLPQADVAELAWAFQESVVDVLATKTLRAARELGCAQHHPRRRRGCQRRPPRAHRRGCPWPGRAARGPRPGLCTDNGAMIGAAGWHRLAAGTRADRSLDARPSLKLAV